LLRNFPGLSTHNESINALVEGSKSVIVVRQAPIVLAVRAGNKAIDRDRKIKEDLAHYGFQLKRVFANKSFFTLFSNAIAFGNRISFSIRACVMRLFSNSCSSWKITRMCRGALRSSV